MSAYYKFYNLSRNKGPFKNIKNVTSNFLNLNKHEHHYIKPSYNKKTNLIINEGKVLINMYVPSVIQNNKNSKNSTNRNSGVTYVNDKENKLNYSFVHTIFAEKERLSEFEIDHDLILTERKYLLQILPNIYFSIYCYKNSNIEFYRK